MQKKQQIYWVCALIDESEVLPMQAAINRFKLLKQHLPKATIALIHGKLSTEEKSQIMQDFALGETDILVCTTVIEVGVDVANASLMIIEDAQRMGLAQLHQLRGRIGRGQYASLCILLYQTPLGYLAKQRLNILKNSQDGFVIAQKDLELRGPGEILGVAQTGLATFKVADLVQDVKLLELSCKIAPCLLKQSTQQQDILINCWQQTSVIDYGNT